MTSEKKLPENQSEIADAQLAIVQSEERFRDLIENTSDWIWEVDASIRYVYASPKVTDLLGYLPEEVLGRTPFDFMPADEAARIKAGIEALVLNPKHSYLDSQLIHQGVLERPSGPAQKGIA